MDERSAAEVLRSNLLELSGSPGAAAIEALRPLVFDYVDDHKSHGWPPERVIVALKNLAHDCGLRPSGRALSSDLPIESKDELFERMVAWSIDRYFVDSTRLPGMTLM